MRRALGVVLLLAGHAGACGAPEPTAVLSPQGLAGREVFLERSAPGCGSCHRLADAGTRGARGPDLDELRPDFERVLEAVRHGARTMPSQARVLSEEEMEAVARYVVEATTPPPAE